MKNMSQARPILFKETDPPFLDGAVTKIECFMACLHGDPDRCKIENLSLWFQYRERTTSHSYINTLTELITLIR